jgi:hypothetical protein
MKIDEIVASPQGGTLFVPTGAPTTLVLPIIPKVAA